MHAKYEVFISFDSKFKANVKVDIKQTNRTKTKRPDHLILGHNRQHKKSICTSIIQFWGIGQGYGINEKEDVSKRKMLYHKYLEDMARFNLRYFVPQVPITGKMLNGYVMISVRNIVQNVKLI